MPNLTLKLTLLLLPIAALNAGPVITLSPQGGALQALPGDTVGWGFAITPDPSLWISFTQVVLVNETNPALGLFLDTLGPQGGPVNAVLAPGAPVWTQPFDAVNSQGLGSYAISPAAAPGDQDSGQLRLYYDTFTADPNSCGACYVASQFSDQPFSVTAAPPQSAAPEPGSLVLLLLGGLAALAKTRGVTRPATRSQAF